MEDKGKAEIEAMSEPSQVYESAEDEQGSIASGSSFRGVSTLSGLGSPRDTLPSPPGSSRTGTPQPGQAPQDSPTPSPAVAKQALQTLRSPEQAAEQPVGDVDGGAGSAEGPATDAVPAEAEAMATPPADGEAIMQQRQEPEQTAVEAAAAAPGSTSPARSQSGSPEKGSSRRDGGGANGSAAAAGAAAGGTASSMFSVPMSNAPATGIFTVPEEAFMIRDLDTGKQYALDKRYWIKDMDTGTVYVLESDPAAGAGAAGASKPPGKVTELLSGREFDLPQFEEALGYFKEPQTAPGPHERQQQGEAATMSASQLAQKSMKSINAGASWVKHSVSSALHKVKAGSPRAGAGGGLTDELAGLELGATGAAAGNLDGRHGVPVKVYRKLFKEFTDLRVAQRLTGHTGVVWTMKFSRNGRYLASAGQDCTIHVWEVSSNRAGGSSKSGTPTSQEDVPLGSSSGSPAAGAARVFSTQPYRVYSGHKQDVLDLCWSKTQFLLSASMDKTVRLWHVTMDECLRVFKHTDFVTAIDFHPSDDKMFLSGSIDGKVRLWNIPEQRVVSWQDVHEMVTAVCYAPHGRKVVLGTMKGKCRFYSIQNNGLEYEAQLDVKNKRGQHARGKKVTGLQFLPTEPGKLLITSNDSRIRLYDGYTLRCKYKGHSNRSTQIRASISPQGDFITCGSDDGWVYVWSTRKSTVPAGASADPGDTPEENPFTKEKNASYECFQANGDIVTVAIFAPESTHRVLGSPAGSTAGGGAEGAGAAGAQAGLHQSAPSLGDGEEGVEVLSSARARGQVIVTAGYSGEITVFEQLGLPQWL